MEVYNTEELCFPQLPNTSCRKPLIPRATVVFLRFLLSLISVFTVVLNLLVIISVSHFRQLHKTTNFLLLSLAISDFMVGLVYFPGETVKLTGCWFLGDSMCFLHSYIVSIIVSSSVGTVVLISADRYVAICDPLHYHTRITMKRIQTCICICWLCAALYNILFIKHSLQKKYDLCNGKCALSVDFLPAVVDLIVSFFLPVTVIVILYLRVFVMAIFQARAIRSQLTVINFQHSVTSSLRKTELKAARTLGVLVVVFLICFCPYNTVALAGDRSFNGSVVVFCLFSFNSCLNPLIYALFYPWFRKAIKYIFTLKILQPGSRDTSFL